MGGEDFIKFVLALLITFIALLTLVFELSGMNFYIELILFLVLLLIGLIALFGIFVEEKFGAVFLFILFGVSLLNSLYLKYKIDDHLFLFAILILVSIYGFVKAISNIEERDDFGFETYDDEIKIPDENVKIEPYGGKGVKKEFSPGKYVASSKGNNYHAAKCDWAKKINKSNRVWLKDKAEAKKKGYKAHSCV